MKLTTSLWCPPSRSMRYNAGMLTSADRAQKGLSDE
jgi:hypothetical protein